LLGTAAAERRELAAAGAPVRDAAAEDGPRVAPRGAQDARRNRCARAALADGDDRPAAAEPVLSRLAHVAIRHVVGAGDEGGVALVGLAHVEHLGVARREHALELVDRYGVDTLVTAARLPAEDVEHPDRVERPGSA